MKHFFILSLLLFIVTSSVSSSSETTLTYDDIYEIDGVTYKNFSAVPFNGEVSLFTNKEKKEGFFGRRKFEDGYLVYEERYCWNGRLEYKYHFVNKGFDVADGEQFVYHCNGNLKDHFFIKNGKAEGIWKVYYENGNLQYLRKKRASETFYEEIYSEDEKLEVIRNFKNGKFDGKYTIFYENGNVSSIENYKDGLIEGVADGFERDGKTLKSRGIFSKGELISPFFNEFYIYHKFPICSFKSSLGQRCKYLSESERDAFTFAKLEGVPNWSDKEQTFSVLTSDWKYGFNITKHLKDKIKLTFTDKSQKASYHTVATFDVLFSAKHRRWVIVSKEINYLRGSEEDKKIEGRIERFRPPIPFIKCNNKNNCMDEYIQWNRLGL